MVDPRVIIPGVNDSGRVLTFTASEALANNYCNAIVESESELLQKEHLTNYTIEEYKPSWTDKTIGFLIHPAVSSILILVMLAGLYFEFQAPGTIFPIAASLLAAVLYFAPLYLEGLAANWEILLFAAGVILLAVEFFVIPGFGITGIAGIICTTLGFALSMLNNIGWDFTFTTKSQLIQSVTVSTGAMLMSIVLVFYLLSRINDSKRLSKLTLQNTLQSEKGFHAPANNDKITAGMKGKAHTDLRPSGKIMIEGKVYDAVAESGWIHKGESVEVVVSGMTLTVRTADV